MTISFDDDDVDGGRSESLPMISILHFSKRRLYELDLTRA